MSRLSALVAKFEEENSDSGFNSTYSRARLGDNSYAPNNQASDSESISEGSRKIRKKRDVYHKIPDDIRVKLLEAVQNGETLKSAAKRYKINYSSAKSILHTYRKEGRILKKSAQERTTKKKVIAYTESEPAELTKSSKKEHTKTGENNRKAVAPLAERITTITTCASQNEESNPSDLNNGLSDNLVSILKMEHYENRLEDSKALTKPSMLHVSYPNMTQEDHVNPLEAFGNNRTPRQKGGKLFDNFYVNYSDFHFPEVGDFHGNEDFTSNMYHTNEFDPFSDVMSALQPKGQKNEDAYADTNTYFYPKGFNSGYNLEEKNGKAENAGTYEENLENTGNPLKSFMDTQKLFQDAVRKVNFFNGSGNQGFRKSSFDLF